MLGVLADALVFGATIIYLGIIFLGLRIPSHYYHDLHKVFKLLLSIGLIATALFSCEEDGVLGITKPLTRTHCKLSSKFAIVTGLLLSISALTEMMGASADANSDGLLSYNDFSDFMESITGGVFTEAFKSRMFDLLGGDKLDFISTDKLPAVFFPLA